MGGGACGHAWSLADCVVQHCTPLAPHCWLAMAAVDRVFGGLELTLRGVRATPRVEEMR